MFFPFFSICRTFALSVSAWNYSILFHHDMCRLIPALLLYVLKSKNYHPIINTAMRQKYPKYSLTSMAAEIWQSL